MRCEVDGKQKDNRRMDEEKIIKQNSRLCEWDGGEQMKETVDRDEDARAEEEKKQNESNRRFETIKRKTLRLKQI